MSIGYCKKSRRQFLIGTGQTLLFVPLLPSLLPLEAFAQSQMAPRRMMNFLLQHHWKPSHWTNFENGLSNVGSIGVKERMLTAFGNSGSSLGQYLTDPIYSSLLQRNLITIARGFNHELSGGNGHVTRTMGGHVTDEAGSSSNNGNAQASYDYVIERSSSVNAGYTNKLKVARVDLQGTWTFVNKDPGSTNSSNPNPYNYYNIGQFYNDLFSGLTGGTTTPQTGVDSTKVRKNNILNRIFPAFQSFKSNRKISKEDQLRLDQHLSYISDLQKQYANTTVILPPAMTCTKPNAPGAYPNMINQKQVNELYIDMLALAFKCGLTQYGAMMFEWDGVEWLPNSPGGRLHLLVHGDSGQQGSDMSVKAFQKFAYDNIAMRFLKNLDEMEGTTGKTYLENMVVSMNQHCGASDEASNGGPHPDYDVQQVMFGNMGGMLRSGRYYSVPRNLPSNTYFMTLLKLMGVPESEYIRYSNAGNRGFGYYANQNSSLGARIFTPVTEMLTAG